MALGNTVDRLRADIDSGRTGDKVPAFDPAAAPLGTDDEAAGAPAPASAIATARAHENARPREVPPRRGLGDAWILVAFAIVLAGMLAAALAVRAGWIVV